MIHSRLTNEADKLTNEADKLTNEADNKCCQPECSQHSQLFGFVVSQVASNRQFINERLSALCIVSADLMQMLCAALVTQTPPTPLDISSTEYLTSWTLGASDRCCDEIESPNAHNTMKSLDNGETVTLVAATSSN